jgi:MFS family permease
MGRRFGAERSGDEQVGRENRMVRLTQSIRKFGRVALPANVWIMTLTSFLTDVSSEMLTTVLPLFLANVLHARTSEIGLIEGVAETTASLLKVASGWISDRLGQRKWLAVAGYALSTVAKPFLLIANAWGLVLAVRFADRLGKGIRTAPRDALVADSVEPSQRGLAFGIHRAGDTAGAVIGLLVALIVVSTTEGGSRTLTKPVFHVLVALSILPALLAVLALAIGAREIRPARVDRQAKKPAHGRLDGRFKVFLAIMLVFTLGNSSDAFLVLRAQDAGLSVHGVLAMMITFNVVYTLISGPAGALSDRVGRRRLLIGGWFVYGAVYLGFASITAGWHAWILMAIYGAYYGMTEGVAKAFVADLVPAERRGTAYGLFNASIGLAAFPASVIAGVLWQGVGSWRGVGPSAPFYFGAAMALAASALLLIAFPSDKPADRGNAPAAD